LGPGPLDGDLRVKAQTPAPQATFDPGLPQNSQKYGSQTGFKASVMVDFARRSNKK